MAKDTAFPLHLSLSQHAHSSLPSSRSLWLRADGALPIKYRTEVVCMKVIWNGKAVVEMLRDFGLCGYEARVYFVLLTLGESKATELTKKAYVPQSKGYDVLDRLIAKGFVELSALACP
jgi:hypothetical protein